MPTAPGPRWVKVLAPHTALLLLLLSQSWGHHMPLLLHWDPAYISCLAQALPEAVGWGELCVRCTVMCVHYFALIQV